MLIPTVYFIVLLATPTVTTPLGFCYYYVDEDLAAKDIDADLCTHLILFSVRMDKDDISATSNAKTAMSSAVGLKARNPKLKVLVSLFDAHDRWNNYNDKTAVVKNVMSFLSKHNLDGLDIYYSEQDTTPTKCAVANDLINGLKLAFSKKYMLTICIRFEAGYCDRNVSVADFVLVRYFMLHGPWRNKTGHASPLTCPTSETCGDYDDLEKGIYSLQRDRNISGDKLVIGFPLFSIPQILWFGYESFVGARQTKGTVPERQAIMSLTKTNRVNFSEICSQCFKDRINVWDDTYKASYLHGKLQWLSYDSKRGICYKTSWLARHGFDAGYMLWTLGMDDHKQACGGKRFPMSRYLKINFGIEYSDKECDGGITLCPESQSQIFPVYKYNATYQNQSFTINCTKGSLTRMCIGNAYDSTWGAEMDDGCETEEKVQHRCDLLLDTLKKAIDDSSSVSLKGIRLVVGCIDDVYDLNLTNQTITTMISMLDNLMELNMETWKKLGNEFHDIDRAMAILQKFVGKMKIPTGMTLIDISSKNIYAVAYNLTELDAPGEPLIVHSKFIKQSPKNSEDLAEPTVTIPYNALQIFERQGIRRINVIAYSNSKLFLSPYSTQYSKEYSVVSIDVGEAIEGHTNQIIAMYEIPQHSDNNITCAFWNETSRKWSFNGVSSIADENGKQSCVTTHLTSFSVLVVAKTDEPIPKDHEVALSYISFIGCGLSIIGLAFTILTHALFKSLRRDKSGKIVLNMCVSMLVLNSVFLFLGEEKELQKANCMAMAFGLHYFLLTTLAWMMIEAVHMYEKLIVVFVESRPWYMRIRMLIAWGLPAIVVSIAAALTVTQNDFESTNHICFLSHINPLVFYGTVLAPACLIIFVNTVVFIRVSKLVLLRTTPAKTTDVSLTSIISLTQVRGAMSVMFVLGVTWIFGPLAIGPLKLAFSYLFTIFNSIQGFLVFVFRCVINTEARLAWKYFLDTGKIKQRRGSLSSTTGGQSSTAKRFSYFSEG